MEGAINSDENSDLFSDALNSFTLLDHNELHYSSDCSPVESFGNQSDDDAIVTDLPKISATSLRRRRFTSRSTENHQIFDTIVTSCESDAGSEISGIKERKGNLHSDSASTLSSVQKAEGGDRGVEISSQKDDRLEIGHGFSGQGVLISLADFMLNAIFFQINILIRCSTFPIWLTYNSFLFVANPVGSLSRMKDDLKNVMLWAYKSVVRSIGMVVPETFMREQELVKLTGRIAWGCFCSFYVGIVLLGLLITGFIFASFMMNRIAEEPFLMIRSLNFDYTKANPDALVMLMPCEGAGCSLGFHASDSVGRGIPPNRKLQLTISLTLPESDYNRNLGVFQVRVEFISIHGKVISGLSKPCMLHFKSSQIRLMETFIKSGPLLAGYSSESQTIDLELPGYIEKTEPTMSIRIVLQRRAEFRPGVGVPEIYAASLKLESKLPILKRLIWICRKTLLVWIAMGFFVWELLIVSVCCRPVLFPNSPQHA